MAARLSYECWGFNVRQIVKILRPIALLFAQLFALTGGAYGATSWNEALSDDAGVGQLPKVASIVVPAGPPTAERDQGAAALRTRLAANGDALVMDSQGIGEVGSLPDKEIIVRCAGLPVEQVIVVRVFESGTHDYQLVATAYDKAGNVRTAFIIKRRDPRTEASQQASDPSVGISAATSGRIQDVLEGHEKDAAAEDETYEQKKKKYYAERLTYGAYEAYRGEYGDKMDLDDFFGKVGRPDLIEKRKQKSANKWAATAGYLLAGAFGTWLLLNSEDCKDVEEPRYTFSGLDGPKLTYDTVRECSPNAFKMSAGATIMIVGLTAGLLTPLTSSSPVTNDEGRRLADAYNETLRKKLGIKSGDVDVKVRLEITQHAVGLGMRLVF